MSDWSRRFQLATGGTFALEEILYFNGGLFSESSVLELATFDGSVVEPHIFGTLFERTLDPAIAIQSCRET